MLLNGQAALVTGCGKRNGLGRAIALALAAAGADVAVTDVAPGGRADESPDGASAYVPEDDWSGLASVVAEIEAMGRRSVALLGDVAAEADAERLIDEAVRAFGQLDILVNNAAAPHGEDINFIWDVPIAAFETVMNVNVTGTFLMSRSLVRHLRSRSGGGAIINISSVSGKKGFARRVAYSASKFAVIGATQAMAQELGGQGIRVNAVCPGPMETERHLDTLRRMVAEGETSTTAEVSVSTPMGRIGRPSEVAEAVVFLASSNASFVNGQALSVDGAFTMG